VPFALGETVELKDDADVVWHQQRLDLAAQAAQAQCDYRLAQLGRSQPMAERIAMAVPIVAGEQPLDYSLGEIFADPIMGIGKQTLANCPLYSG
jgi:hypothetical protein